jgi:polyisoprenyl-phosphate glycosyltransferase
MNKVIGVPKNEKMSGGLISIVVPIFNEQEVLPELHRRLTEVLRKLPLVYEIIYVNDGSQDSTLEIMYTLRQTDPRVTILDLSRNFGKEIAMTAGLDHAHGDAVVVIDADLQDPPELIPDMVHYWHKGYDVVYAKRTAREGETWLKKATAALFYQLIRRVSRIYIPEDVGDFRLLSRRAVDALKTLREQHRFMKGLFAWIGFHQIAVPYHRDPRFAGQTKWNYWKLWNFALEGITSFTIAPLKIAMYGGSLIAGLAFIYAIVIITKTLLFGDPARGYPSLMVTVLFLGGVQLVCIGILGEYVGRMFNESKMRPLYFLNDLLPAEQIDCPDSKKKPS